MGRKHKTFLFGANGVIGSYLLNHANNDFEGFSKTVSSNSSYSKLNCLNINDLENFAKRINSDFSIIFLIGLAHKKGKGKDLPTFRSVNKQTLVNLITVLEKYEKIPDKIIFASSISVYGERYQTSIYNENLLPNPYSPYGITKLEAEKYLTERYPERTWILRFAPVYHRGFKLNLFRRSKLHNFYYRVGKGNKKLSLCNINNIVTVVSNILNNKISEGIYNVSDNIEYTYNDLLNKFNPDFIIPIPLILLKLLYLLGVITKNNFIKENTIKLLTHNVFPSKKIIDHLILDEGLNYTLNEEFN